MTPWRGAVAQSSICMRCEVRAIESQGRWYSTNDTPRDPEASSSSRTNKDVEAELQSILKPRPSPAPPAEPEPHKIEDKTSDDAKPEEIRSHEMKSDIPKSEDSIPQDPRPSPDFEPQQTPSRAEQLRDLAQTRINELSHRFSFAMDTLQARAVNASQTLNDITGYSDIEVIKKQNAELEIKLAQSHEQVRNARQAYKTSNARRATTQREVTTLLARKDSWSPADLERFTELYRTDHILEGEVSTSQETLTEAEVEEQSLSQRLNSGILKRYHEEQIWSDRIRRASTWGTFSLMGMNFLLFIVVTFVAEPWRRKRLVKGVVAEEKAVLEEVRGQLEQVKLALEGRNKVAAIQALSEAAEVTDNAEVRSVEGSLMDEEVPAADSISMTEATPTTEAETETAPVVAIEPIIETQFEEPIPARTWKEVLLDPAWWRVKTEDLYSERRIDLRMKDASLLALEGALAGAVFAGSIAMLLVRRS